MRPDDDTEMRGADTSLSLLGRIAACLWFLVVTGLFMRGLVAMLLSTPTAGASFSDWSAVLSVA